MAGSAAAVRSTNALLLPLILPLQSLLLIRSAWSGQQQQQQQQQLGAKAQVWIGNDGGDSGSGDEHGATPFGTFGASHGPWWRPLVVCSFQCRSAARRQGALVDCLIVRLIREVNHDQSE